MCRVNCHHWFRYGLLPGQGQATSHCRNQYWNIVNWTLRNKIQWNLNRNSYIFIKKMHLKISSAKWRPFCLSLNVLTWEFRSSRCHFTHWGLSEPNNLLLRTFQMFSWMKIFIQEQWTIFLMVQLRTNKHWFRLWLGSMPLRKQW